MDLVKAISDFERFLLKIGCVREPVGKLTFNGRGKDTIYRVEKELNCQLPVELRTYIERYAPAEEANFEALSMPHISPWFNLFKVEDLGAEKTQPWLPLPEDEHGGDSFLAVGESGSEGAVVNLSYPHCPVYISDEFGLEPLTDSLADFLKILYFREVMFGAAEAKNETVESWATYDGNEFDAAKRYIIKLGYENRLSRWGL